MTVPSASFAETDGSKYPSSAPGSLSGRHRFLGACACQAVDVTPVWLMRQAGRVLPEYRALKKSHSFLELVRTPELAAEVTLQPIRRFAFDAAIIFSDILVIPEALGQAYHFAEEGGVRMDFALRSRADIERLSNGSVRERLSYVGDAIRIIKPELNGRAALLGFSGAPWTLANFMIEGGSSREFHKARLLLESDAQAYEQLATLLTRAITEYLHLQIDAGAEAIQIFDTLASLLPAEEFMAGSGRWIAEIVAGLGGRVPVIVFAKGARAPWTDLVAIGSDVLGIDHSVGLRTVRDQVPARTGLQGNLDPAILETTPAVVAREARAILDSMHGRPGHIFNLGHGVPPNAPLANLEALVATVRAAP